MGVLPWWRTLGLKLACEKGSSGPEVWIGTHFTVNKVEVSVEEERRDLGGTQGDHGQCQGNGQACRHPKVGG